MADGDLESCLVRLLEQRSHSVLGRAAWHGLLSLRANLDAELEIAAADDSAREAAMAVQQRLQAMLGTDDDLSWIDPVTLKNQQRPQASPGTGTAQVPANAPENEPPLEFHDDLPIASAVPPSSATDELAAAIHQTLKNSQEPTPKIHPVQGLEQAWKQYQLISLCISRSAKDQLDQAIAAVGAKFGASIRAIPQEASQIDALYAEPGRQVLAPGLQAAGQVIAALVGNKPNDRHEALGNAAMRWVEWAVPLIDFQHGLREASRHGLRRLDDVKEKQKFLKIAAGRILEMKQATDARGRFLAALGIDEIFRSLFMFPTPPPDSWWSLQLQNSFDLLSELALTAKEQRGNPRRLSGRYADVCSSSQSDIGIPAPQYGATPGQVVWCLRPWAQCGGSELPGRVVYFSEG